MRIPPGPRVVVEEGVRPGASIQELDFGGSGKAGLVPWTQVT